MTEQTHPLATAPTWFPWDGYVSQPEKVGVDIVEDYPAAHDNDKKCPLTLLSGESASPASAHQLHSSTCRYSYGTCRDHSLPKKMRAHLHDCRDRHDN